MENRYCDSSPQHTLHTSSPFDECVCRRVTGCMKWDHDLDVFGFAVPPSSYYDSIIHWHSSRHNVHYQREWMIVVPGVVPAISAILKALTRPGNGVLLLSPVYNCFYSSIRNLGFIAEESKLLICDGLYEIDFDYL